MMSFILSKLEEVKHWGGSWIFNSISYLTNRTSTRPRIFSSLFIIQQKYTMSLVLNRQMRYPQQCNGSFTLGTMGTNEIKFNTNKYIQYRHLIPLKTFQISPRELASSSREGINLLLKDLLFPWLILGRKLSLRHHKCLFGDFFSSLR